ncbi:MAG TPA: heparinase II/III family protein [Gemmatimonadales bacterium]
MTIEELEARAALVAAGGDLGALARAMRGRAERTLREAPFIPQVKALLSQDGGVCPRDGAALAFDPWSPRSHRCPKCGTEQAGERHHRWWARFQHLWLAEQAAELAALAAVTDDAEAAQRAGAILEGYAHYADLPNRDNVLGPSRLFFSTYLESIWATNYLAAAVLLRERGLLDDGTAAVVGGVADEAAAVIGEFNEGFSNRQTWHNAALAAIGVWFEDEELAGRAIESETGLLAHLAHGFAADGCWHEGENYHLFALQGALTAIRWARSAGVEPLADPELARRVAAALRAPILTALPDHTFPARKDSRFGVSLAQPMYLELWERGLGITGGTDEAGDIGAWLRSLYAAPAPAARDFDSWLYEAGGRKPDARSRESLSWNALFEMAPELPDGGEPGQRSVYFPSQGLAVLRRGNRYVSLECGEWSSGHGHPDRLNLTVHADAVHWLPDVGTGSYVSRDLFWYRSTLAHNAPRLDGTSQEEGDATCAAFEAGDEWSWVRGTWGPLTRTVVLGPSYLVDLLEMSATDDRLLELPWHLDGAEVESPGRWEPHAFDDEFVADTERFVPEDPGAAVRCRARSGGAEVTLHLAPGATLMRGTCPGAPGQDARRRCLVEQVRGMGGLLVAVLGFGAGAVAAVRLAGTSIEVDTPAGTDRHAATTEGWDIRGAESSVRLGGLRAPEIDFEPLVTKARPLREHAAVPYARDVPALDGSGEGFERAASIHLDHEDQYRRSEEPFDESFRAEGRLLWDADALYLAVDVAKPELVFRPADAPPLRLDNEPDDIHSDGLQVYLRPAGGPTWAVLVVPEADGGIRVRPMAGSSAAAGEVRGAWTRTEEGYRVTLALSPESWNDVRLARSADFDLIVNEMRPDRERRAGQLVWSGGGGWVYLRGDRQPAERFGVIDLA